MNEVMWQEIQLQPAALRENLHPLRERAGALLLLASEFKRIYVAGCGDSFFAPLALRQLYQMHLDIPVEALPSMETSQYINFRPGDLLIGISVSGSVRRTVEAVLSARAAGAQSLAITGNAASRLAQNSDATLIMPVPSLSRKTPHSVDYAMTLFAPCIILEKIAKHRLEQLEALPDLVAQTLKDVIKPCTAAAAQVAASDQFYFLGAGPHWATAQYGAAKFWEAGGLFALAFELEEFAHGAHLMLKKGDAVFVIAPDGFSLSRACEFVPGLLELGARVYVITNRAEVFSDCPTWKIPMMAEEWTPFTSCIPLQLVCWGIANVLNLDVVTKTARIPNLEAFDHAQARWTRESEERPRIPSAQNVTSSQTQM